MRKKNVKKIVGYLIPIVALVVAGVLGIDDVASIEGALAAVVTAVFGLLAALGVVDNNDDVEQDDGND